MKWLGQYIQDLPSRFRDDVYLESISTGTIASGAHLGLDSNNKIVKATDGGGDLTSIVAGAGLSGTSLTGPIPTLIVDFSEFATITPTNGDSLATLDSDGATEQLTSISRLATLFAGTGLTASSSVIGVDAAQTQITSVGTIGTGVWNGDVVASAYLDTDTAHLSGTQSFTGTKTFDETISGAIDGNAATATTLATTRAINGVNFNGSAAITIPTNRVYGATIKLLPNDFLPNEDGGTSKGVFLDDTAPTGLKPGIAAMELVAVQDIPEGFKATQVDVYASTDLVIQAYEMDLNASGITSRSSAGTANTTLALTAAVNATATNFIAIIVTTTATSNRVWGGTITIESQ
jgi:hypothetical protein